MNTIRIKVLWIGVVALALFTTSCHKKDHATLAEDTRPTVAVKVMEAGGGTIEDFFTVSGKIRAEKSADVSARMIGALTSVTVKVGDRVSSGQTLATISNTDIMAKRAQADAGILEAETGLKNIERDFARITSLFEKQSATQKELDDITTHRDMMLAKLQQAKEMRNEVNAMLSYTSVKAPFSGTITEKYVNGGDLASPGRPMFHIESGKTFQAEAMIPESYINSVEKGDEVKVVVKSSGREIGGKINELSQSSLNTGGQYLVKINLDKKDLTDVKLLSGMYVNVLVPSNGTAGQTGKITVNKDAIVTQGQLSGLYTVSDQQTAVLRWVRLGRTFGDQVEILSGLSAGEQYVVESEGRLLNGIKIELK
ncbi:MAG: efflux RND transporter periplasmic adaptor subunit [Bacteroidetes bacterium]|nr:efflux RND transporter periplasmic adaptor subunit [Bacteroidota bacterium]